MKTFLKQKICLESWSCLNTNCRFATMWQNKFKILSYPSFSAKESVHKCIITFQPTASILIKNFSVDIKLFQFLVFTFLYQSVHTVLFFTSSFRSGQSKRFGRLRVVSEFHWRSWAEIFCLKKVTFFGQKLAPLAKKIQKAQKSRWCQKFIRGFSQKQSKIRININAV